MAKFRNTSGNLGGVLYEVWPRIDFDGLDGVTKWAMEMPGVFRQARKSALGSVGYYIKEELKGQGRYQTYVGWPRRSPYTQTLYSGKRNKKRYGKSRSLRYKTGEQKGWIKPKLSKSLNPMSRLVNAVRYNVRDDGDDYFAEIGFLSTVKPYIIKALPMLAKGYTINVTKRTRELFWANRLPLAKDTNFIKVPPRPWIEPVYKGVRHKIPGLFYQKFWASYERNKGRKRSAA